MDGRDLTHDGATTTCENSGTIKLSPGLSNTATVQNVTIKGKLSNCSSTESAVTEGKYVAHLKTEAVTCAVLAGEGALLTESNVVFNLKPKEGGNPMGTFDFPVTEKAGVSLSGLVESGAFEGGAIGGSVSQAYAGGETCGIPNGKKKAKKVNKGTFTGSLSL
ncbi:MAG TPA: hypothetical protein VMG80_03200 [Solirubrobacteraceae bacterium]|nr:hypothetical protein [Solirubrobacteraceae bacterium]